MMLEPILAPSIGHVDISLPARAQEHSHYSRACAAFTEHPEVEIITRDRAQLYDAVLAAGAPQAGMQGIGKKGLTPATK
jgi:hypothetical protein